MKPIQLADPGFARKARSDAAEWMLIFDFDKVMRVTVGISEIRVSCVRTDKIRSDGPLERRTFPLKPNPPIPTT